MNTENLERFLTDWEPYYDLCQTEIEAKKNGDSEQIQLATNQVNRMESTIGAKYGMNPRSVYIFGYNLRKLTSEA